MRASPKSGYFVSYRLTMFSGAVIESFATPDAAFFEAGRIAKKSGYVTVVWTWEGGERRIRAEADETGVRWLPVKEVRR